LDNERCATINSGTLTLSPTLTYPHLHTMLTCCLLHTLLLPLVKT
jgi:hypothetical protein